MTHRPLISVIMPVHDRRPLVEMALASYSAQDYENTELIIIDDSNEPLVHLFDDIPEARYVWTQDNLSIGTKRNLACSAANGQIICHCDSDDISAPDRISSQVRDLMMSKHAITGFYSLPFYDLMLNRAHLYSYNRQFCCGATLMYTRDFWRGHEFPDIDVGEDLPFTVENRDDRFTTDGRRMMVALLHSESTSSRQQVQHHPEHFPEILTSELPDFFFPYLQMYNPAVS